MIDRCVRVAVTGKRPIGDVIIRHDASARNQHGLQGGDDDLKVTARDDFGLDFAATLDRAQHDMLVVEALPVMAADERFVRLDNTESAERIVAIYSAHVLADFVAHAPSGFVIHGKLALQFFGRNAVPRRSR